MTDDDRLVGLLLTQAGYHEGYAISDVCKRVANRIESLTAEVARLRATLRDLYGCVVVTPSGYLTLVSDKKTWEAYRRAAAALGEGEQ